MHAVFLILEVALAALSARSISVLSGLSPWTRAGWGGTLAYCISSVVEYSGAPSGAAWAMASYACLIVLTVAFVLAGVRDEPQAEPWFWPHHAGSTRRQRRR